MQKKFLLSFILLSFISKTIVTYEGSASILGRITFADLFGALALLFGIRQLLLGYMKSRQISFVYYAGFFMVLLFFLPILFSYNQRATIVESLIILFLILISITIFYQFKDKLIKIILPTLIYTLLLSSILGFYDVLASTIGLPRIFSQRNDGEAMSGFRNAGQAGAYYLVLLTILIPLKYSKLKLHLKPREQKFLDITLVLGLLFIFATGKIAAYIGIVAGILFYAIKKRNLKTVLLIVISSFSISIIYANLDKIAPDLYIRLEDKIQERIIRNVDGTSQNDFFTTNWGSAINTFEDLPLTGSGLGAFAGNFHQNEVHSTYLKMLAETGLIGTFGYLILMFLVYFLFKRPKSHFRNIYYDYLGDMLPFFFGCVISWSYTYHLRKREFWIFVAVLMITRYMAKKQNLEVIEEMKSQQLTE
tara:strand:+ start:6044 stop:7303 length:1260 start_codon:yes stop_codon:yes gene_type:complete